jgi:hypothetical protein
MNKYARIGLGAAFVIAAAGAIILLVMRPKSRPDAVTLEGTAVQGRLSAVGHLYAQFREARGRSPDSLEEFVQFGRQLPGSNGPIVFDEAYLTLPRDKQIMVIRYGLKLPTPPPRPEMGGDGPVFTGENGPILAYEQTGVNGRRFVVFAGSNRVEEVDEEAFKQHVGP